MMMMMTCLRGIEYIIQFLFIHQSFVVKLREGGGASKRTEYKNCLFFSDRIPFF